MLHQSFWPSEESLAAVNKHLTTPVDMRSFRPSIVIQGCEAFEEDAWTTLSIGDVVLRKFKRCPRYLDNLCQGKYTTTYGLI